MFVRINCHVCGLVHLCRIKCDEFHECVELSLKIVIHLPLSEQNGWGDECNKHAFRCRLPRVFNSWVCVVSKHICEVLVVWGDCVEASSCLWKVSYTTRLSHMTFSHVLILVWHGYLMVAGTRHWRPKDSPKGAISCRYSQRLSIFPVFYINCLFICLQVWGSYILTMEQELDNWLDCYRELVQEVATWRRQQIL